MTPTAFQNGTPSPSFIEYMRIARRRILIILISVVLVPVMSVVFAQQQTPKYKATATTLLNHVNLGASLSGLPQDTSAITSPDRALATEASLARTPAVAAAVIKATGVRLTPGQFLTMSSVTPSTDADLINVSVTTAAPATAIRLAGEYARQFAAYSNDVEGAALSKAYDDVTRRLAQLRTRRLTGSPLYTTLRARQQQIVALQTLQTPTVQVVKLPDGAPKVSPRPKRTALIGLLGGIVLAVALVLISEAIDTRVRDLDEVEAALGIPLLARIPPPSGSVLSRRRDGSPLAHQADDAQAEAYRMLRTNLSFVRLGEDFKTVLVTSPASGDGKTTTVVSLGIAFARSGLDVVMADLDARKPELAARLDRNPRYGLTEVALGKVDPLQALETVPLGPQPLAMQVEAARSGQRPSSNGSPLEAGGRLRLLGFGRLRPPAPHEFLASHVVRDVLQRLADDADLVLVDSAPILLVGDSLSLSGVLDATLYVIRSSAIIRPDLKELKRVIAASPSRPLGLVATGADVRRAYGYGYGYGAEPPASIRPSRERRSTQML